ncbi:MAG: AAA family ATPase [Desulfatiglandaceae bacterium]
MIKSIMLNRFGKFEKAFFDFSPVTVFAGENESGKTTIFDALFEGICRPKGNTVHGKRLAARYGPARESTIEFDGEGISMDSEHFLNLNAIGSGRIRVDFSGGSSWVERLKSSLFTGGIHPRKLADEFDVLAKEKGMFTHVLNYRKRSQEKDQTEKHLEELNQRKATILEKEKQLDRLRRELKELSSRKRELEKQIAEKERLLEQQAKIRERQSLIRTLTLITEARSLEDQLGRLAGFEEDRSEELKNLSTEIGNLEAKISALAGEEQRARERLDAATAQVEKKTAEAAAMETAAGVAAGLLSRIEIEAPRTVIRKVVHWNRSLLLLSFLPPAAGFAALALFPGAAPPAVVIGASIAIFLILLVSAKKTEERTCVPDTSEFVNRLKDDWRTRSGGGELKSSTIEGIQGELLALRSESDAAGREVSRLRNEKGEISAFLAHMSSSKSALESETAVLRGRLNETLHGLGVKSVEEYIGRRIDYQHEKKDFRKKLAEIETEMKRLNTPDIDLLKVECETRAAELAAQITVEKETDAGMNLLKHQLSRLREELDDVASHETSLRSEVDKKEGELKGSLGKLPVEIYEAEQALRRCGQELLEMEIDRKAAALARDIFVEMSRDTDSIFMELSADIAGFLDGMLPESRHVALRGFKAGDIEISDAGGALRVIENLSTGTRDVFHLAARLALARRMHQGDRPGLVVLDEPFHSLDGPRTLLALDVLQKFHREHGWQIILFTKETYITAEMEQMHPDLKSHHLTATKPA